MENGQLKRKPNKYYVIGSTPPTLPEEWSLQAKQVTLPDHLAEPTKENFMEVYSMVLQAMVPQARLKKIMGRRNMPKCKPMNEAYAAEQVQENNARMFFASTASKRASGRSPPDWNLFEYDQDFHK